MRHFAGILFTLLLLSVVSMPFAQPAKSDSLQKRIKLAQGKEQVKLLIELSNTYEDIPERVKCAEHAIKLASKENVQLQVEAQLNLAQIYSDDYQDNNALAVYATALRNSITASYTNGVLGAYDGLMRSYFYLDSVEKSKEYAKKLVAEAQKAGSIKYRSNAYLQMARILQGEGNVDSSLKLTYLTLDLRKQLGDKLDIAQTYNFLGRIYYDDARFTEAVECYEKEIGIKEEIGKGSRLLAVAYQNLGNTQFAIGNYQLALEKTQKALKLFEGGGYEDGVAVCCTGIGDIYQNLSQSELATEQNKQNFQKALEYYNRALVIFKKSNDIDNQGIVLQSIGTVHSRLRTNSFVALYGESWEDTLHTLQKKDIESGFSDALRYYNEALGIYNEKSPNRRAIRDIVNVNTNIGSIYNWCRDWKKARGYINKALALSQTNGLTVEKTSAYYALGENSLGAGLLDEAEGIFLKCATLARQHGLKETLRYCYSRLSQIYERAEDYPNALLYHKKSIKIKDAIFTEKSQRSITEMQTLYETERKERENKLLRNEKELQESVIQRQRLMIVGALLGVALILMVALLMFKMFRDKQKANKILEEKNRLITEQKNQITDSIRYASSIQNAVLPTGTYITEMLSQHFVLFLPKDIVSGDFYWTTRVGNKVIVAAVDCTGHGVPGAFMSMLGISFLFEIVSKDGVLQPATILNLLRTRIKTTLSQTGKVNEQKDGMDMSLCVIDTANSSMEWAGAYNPLCQVRGGALIEHKADKMPVAVHVNDNQPFTNHNIDVQQGDTFYMYSDGYADQFGGDEGRKFMSKRFKELLISIAQLPMEQQREILYQTHMQWRGTAHEQVDDILVMGFRV